MDERKFVADLIQALKDADRASKIPKSQVTIAQETYQKLQFDFPLVTPSELSALTNVFITQPLPSWAKLTDKFIDVVLENSIDNDINDKEGDDNGNASQSNQNLIFAYQQLLASSLLCTLKACFETLDDKHIDQLLQGINADSSSSSYDDVTDSRMRSLIYDTSDDSDTESNQHHHHHQQQQTVVNENTTTTSDNTNNTSTTNTPIIPSSFNKQTSNNTTTQVYNKLIYLSSKLHYNRFNNAWNLAHTSQCLASLRNNKNFLQLVPIAGMLCTLLHDRAVAVPEETDVIVKSVLSSLQIESIDHTTSIDEAAKTSIILAVGTVSSLIHRSTTNSTAKRKLYGPVRDSIIPAAARLLEKCESQRAQRERRLKKEQQQQQQQTASTTSDNTTSPEEEEELHVIISASTIIEFLIIQGNPPLAKPIHVSNLLQSSGILGSLVMSYIHRSKIPSQRSMVERAQRALLVACATSNEINAWVKQVPGFEQAILSSIKSDGGGDTVNDYNDNRNDDSNSSKSSSLQSLYYYLFQALSSNSNNNDGVDECIAKLLRDSSMSNDDSDSVATNDNDLNSYSMVDCMPVLYDRLQLMYTVHQARKREKIWGSETEKALNDIGNVLRKDLIDKKKEEDIVDDDTRREKVMDSSLEDRTRLLAERRAQVVQPECLRMIKVMVSKDDSSSKCE